MNGEGYREDPQREDCVPCNEGVGSADQAGMARTNIRLTNGLKRGAVPNLIADVRAMLPAATAFLCGSRPSVAALSDILKGEGFVVDKPNGVVFLNRNIGSQKKSR